MTPSRRWSYVEPTSATDPTPVVVTMTEQQIVEHYFAYWRARMVAVGKAEQATVDACVDEWVVVHWATPDPPA